MGASLEIFAGAVRGGPDHNVLGDPYEWFLEARASTEEFGVVVLGPAGSDPMRHRHEIGKCLAPHFDFAEWDRVLEDGTKKRVRYPLARYR